MVQTMVYLQQAMMTVTMKRHRLVAMTTPTEIAISIVQVDLKNFSLDIMVVTSEDIKVVRSVGIMVSMVTLTSSLYTPSISE